MWTFLEVAWTRSSFPGVTVSPGWRIKSVLLVGLAFLAPSTNLVHAETKGPVTDEIGVIEVAKGAPITVGHYWVISGADSSLGIDSQRGVELGFDSVNNTVAGHPVQLVLEDEGCSAEGGQTAATKLAVVPNIVGVIGSVCSSGITAAAPILWKAGIVDIGTGSAPSLTAPDRKPEYEGFMRTIFSDADQGFNDAEWFHKELKCSTMATIHDGSPYTSQLVKVAAKHFKELGGEIVAEEAVAPTDVDMRPVLTRVAVKKPCVLYFPVFIAAAAQIARQAQEIGDLKDSQLIAGSVTMAPGMLEAAGDAAKGLRLTAIDISPEVMGKDYPAFLERYKARYGESPINAYHAHAYDAAVILAKAIEKVAKTDDKGTTFIGKKALRDELFATKGYEGLSGPINCNPHGQCGGFTFAVYQYVDSDPATFKVGTNPIKIYPKK
jgi:branched-chain amino acid transport system substrate-binding protein